MGVRSVNIFLILLLFSITTLAQGKGSLRGYITDSESGEALAYGNALIEELNVGASSDTRGYFFIPSIPEGKNYTLLVSYIGYISKKIKFRIKKNRITYIEVTLAPSTVQMETIEKIGKKVIEKNATDIGLERISIKSLQTLPKGVEVDILRSLQTLPGVRTTGDVSSRYYVQGGAGNQNLVLLNGVTVYNPFHALGLFSVIDPEMINNMEFYKGGFSSEFGGRLSSVLNLRTKDGNKNRISATGSASMLTGKMLVEGPIPHGSFIVTGRKSHSTDVLKTFLNDEDAPFKFYDYSFKLNYTNPNFIEEAKFVIHGFFSGDDLDNHDPTRENFTWENNILGFSWFQVYPNLPLYSEAQISVSNFEGKLIPNLSGINKKENEITDANFKMSFNYIFNSKDEFWFGFDITSLDTKLLLENAAGLDTREAESSTSIDLFLKYKFMRYENLGIDFGTRLNFISLANKNTSMFEPRLSLTYQFSPLLKLKGAAGIYLQEMTTLTDEDEVISLFEPWLICPKYLKTPRAGHLIFGFDSYFTDKFSLNVEGYYKYIWNLPALNNEKYFENDHDLVSGTGESYGWEFQVKYSGERINFSTSYSLSWAYKEVKGWLYYPKYDARHSLNISSMIDFGKGWQAGIVWTFSSGLPFTQDMGFYNKLKFADLLNRNHLYDSYNPYAILFDKNMGRLPSYHRLDLNLSKKIEFYFLKLYFDISIINAYDRNNIFYFERDTGKKVNMLPFFPSASIKVEI